MADDPLTELETLRCRLVSSPHGLGKSNEARARDVDAFSARLGDNGAWDDIDYGPGELLVWPAMSHLTRLAAMAEAWQHDPTAARLDVIDNALSFWFDQWPVNPNWWHNEIGAPSVLADILLRIKPGCSSDLIQRAVPAFENHQPALRFTGQNLIWVASIQLAHGVLVDAPVRVRQACTLIQREVRVGARQEEGLQADMSFYQHGQVLYSGGYGQNFALDVAKFAWVCQNTEYAWPDHKSTLLAGFILDGSRWMVRGKTFEYGAIGREITRVGHSAQRFFDAATYMADISGPRQHEFAAIANSPNGSFVDGNRYFYCADIMLQHRASYSLSVRVASDRLENADWPCCGGEGRLCHHMAEGATFIYGDGDEYRDIFPVWNWRQVPGTTVVQTPGPFVPEDLRGFGANAFAGGASDGDVGCMALDHTRGELKVRKAWFLFDDRLIALGAGLCSTDSAPVRTTINQCRQRGDVWAMGEETPLEPGTHSLAPGSQFWHDRVAYSVFDGNGTLRLGPQSGAWNDCGVGSTEQQIQNVVNIGLEHGVCPAEMSYAYGVMPGCDRERASTWTGHAIIANDVRQQAVWHADEMLGQVVFYEAGNLRFPDGQALSVNRPCALLYRKQPGRAVLTVADPSQLSSEIHIQLSGPVNTSIVIPFPSNAATGASTTIVTATL